MDEKNIVKLLKKPKKKRVEKSYDITDLILDHPYMNPLFEGDERYTAVGGIKSFKKSYPLIDKNDLTQMIRIEYGKYITDVFEFKSDYILEKNIQKMINCQKKSCNKKKSKISCHAMLIKDVYAIFVYYPFTGGGIRRKLSICESLVESYEKKFGFKEV